jgi:hypothetical protein
MASELSEQLEGIGVPYDKRLASIAGRDQESTVGAEGEGVRWTSDVDDAQFLARKRIPQSDGPIIAASRDSASVRAVRHVRHNIVVTSESHDQLPGGHVPDGDRRYVLVRQVAAGAPH